VTVHWFGSQNWSPAVRLILSERVSVDEINSENLSFFQLAPNPAVDVTRVNFELKANSNVAYEVRDVNGKLISFSNMGKFSAGKNSFDLNVSSFENGNYMVSLVIDGSRMFTKVLNVVR